MSLREKYDVVSRIISNTVLLFLGLNLCLYPIQWYRDHQVRLQQDAANNLSQQERPGLPPMTKKRNGYQMLWVDARAYGGLSEDKVSQTLDDFYDFQTKAIVYEPYVQFSDPIFASSTLNLSADKRGFVARSDETAASIFFLGGSTTLGWNVSDDQTIPAYFSDLSGQKIQNYGHTNYSWYQEMTLLQRMLHAGHRPKSVVFIDGVNILNVAGAKQFPHWTFELEHLWTQKQLGASSSALPGWLPVFRLINKIQRGKAETQYQIRLADYSTLNKEPDSKPDTVKSSYLNVKKQIEALGKQFGFEPYFVLQPNRGYHCDNQRYAHPLPTEFIQTIQPIYDELKTIEESNFLDLSELCQGERDYLFVDDVHYSPDFNRKIAKQIFERWFRTQSDSGLALGPQDSGSRAPDAT